MPLEIKELVIKVNVSEPSSGQANNARPNSQSNQAESQKVDKKAIVQECVDQVMEILKNKMER